MNITNCLNTNLLEIKEQEQQKSNQQHPQHPNNFWQKILNIFS
ncbi:hypothetical protein [Limosilactobacillus sp.]|jgi:hypothetical protein|nr:hypothetical protein [Limosilactobacillus sp.]